MAEEKKKKAEPTTKTASELTADAQAAALERLKKDPGYMGKGNDYGSKNNPTVGLAGGRIQTIGTNAQVQGPVEAKAKTRSLGEMAAEEVAKRKGVSTMPATGPAPKATTMPDKKPMPKQGDFPSMVAYSEALRKWRADQ